jgi:hypothetical protein
MSFYVFCIKVFYITPCNAYVEEILGVEMESGGDQKRDIMGVTLLENLKPFWGIDCSFLSPCMILDLDHVSLCMI